MSFLSDPDKLRQLQFSTAAKMEWNRRVIKEELDSGMHCPTVMCLLRFPRDLKLAVSNPLNVGYLAEAVGTTIIDVAVE